MGLVWGFVMMIGWVTLNELIEECYMTYIEELERMSVNHEAKVNI